MVPLIRNTLIAVVLLISLTRCESGAVEDRFEEIIVHIDSGHRNAVFPMLDQPSEAYFAALMESARRNDVASAIAVGNQHGIPITTLCIYEQIAMDPDTLGEYDEYLDYISTEAGARSVLNFVLSLNNMGIFRHEAEAPIKIYEGVSVSGNTAKLSVTVPTGASARLATTYAFTHEDGVWNLNFPSTLTVIEKIYAQGFRASGLSEHDYARTLINSGDKQIAFRYMSN